jgi:hypothetical protein
MKPLIMQFLQHPVISTSFDPNAAGFFSFAPYTQTPPVRTGFEVLAAVSIESTVFWDVMLFNPIEGLRRFGGTYFLHLQGRKISHTKSTNESATSVSHYAEPALGPAQPPFQWVQGLFPRR